MTVPADWSIEFVRDTLFRVESAMSPRAVCPHCRNASTFVIRAQYFVTQPSRMAIAYLVIECNYLRCKKITYVQTSIQNNSNTNLPNDEFFMYPSRAVEPAHSSVPSNVADDWKEAQTAVQAGAPKAGAVMCRRVLYGVLLDKGCKLRPLHEGLKQLIQDQRLPAIFDDWLPAIRDDGHDGAHPDRSLQVSPENLAETMEYTSELLRFLYIEPFEFQQRKARNATP